MANYQRFNILTTNRTRNIYGTVVSVRLIAVLFVEKNLKPKGNLLCYISRKQNRREGAI